MLKTQLQQSQSSEAAEENSSSSEEVPTAVKAETMVKITKKHRKKYKKNELQETKMEINKAKSNISKIAELKNEIKNSSKKDASEDDEWGHDEPAESPKKAVSHVEV